MDKLKMPNMNMPKMPNNLHNPIPYDNLTAECAKAASILDHFIKNSNKVDAALIPPKVLEKAKGIAVITVVKAGFVWTGKIGSGLVVAKLSDGRWSAPSSIAMTGVGFGAQIGAQLTDFVFILNTPDAVKAFSHGGNITLGAQVGIAAGPVGRSLEGSGSVINPAPIYSYSKNKGLFAGVSLEGSIIMTRNEANAVFYHRKVTPAELLSGEIEPPAMADPLYRALNLRFGGNPSMSSSPTFAAPPFQSAPTSFASTDTNSFRDGTLNNNRAASLPRPPVALPTAATTKSVTAIALYDYTGERAADLSFKKGDVITILKQTDSNNDWWQGRVGNKEGDFPANYVSIRK